MQLGFLPLLRVQQLHLGAALAFAQSRLTQALQPVVYPLPAEAKTARMFAARCHDDARGAVAQRELGEGWRQHATARQRDAYARRRLDLTDVCAMVTAKQHRGTGLAQQSGLHMVANTA